MSWYPLPHGMNDRPWQDPVAEDIRKMEMAECLPDPDDDDYGYREEDDEEDY